MDERLVKRWMAEFVGAFVFVFIGVGAIHAASNLASGMGMLGVGLAHGFTIAVRVMAVRGELR